MQFLEFGQHRLFIGFLFDLCMDFEVLWLVFHLLSKRNILTPCLFDLELVCPGKFIDVLDPMTGDDCRFCFGFVIED